jgi:hypothetical protein
MAATAAAGDQPRPARHRRHRGGRLGGPTASLIDALVVMRADYDR